MVLGGTIYSAMDGPGGPILGGTTYSMTDPSCSGDSVAAACGGTPPLAVSNKAASTAAETSSANNAGTVERSSGSG